MYLLRAKQIGLTMADMDQLEEGFVLDMIIEMGNDNAAGSYRELATQDDFDRF